MILHYEEPHFFNVALLSLIWPALQPGMLYQKSVGLDVASLAPAWGILAPRNHNGILALWGLVTSLPHSVLQVPVPLLLGPRTQVSYLHELTENLDSNSQYSNLVASSIFWCFNSPPGPRIVSTDGAMLWGLCTLQACNPQVYTK